MAIIFRFRRKLHSVNKSDLFIIKVWQNFWAQNGASRVGSFSYTVLVSFIPFTISVASIINQLPLSNRFIKNVEKFIFSHFLPGTGDFFYQQFRTSFSHANKSLSWFGFGFLFITAYLMLKSLEKHINEMWHIKIHRKFGYSVLIYVLFMLFGPVIACLILWLQLYARTSYGLLNHSILAWYHPLSAVLTILTFVVIYQVLPATKVKFSHALFAGIIAGLLFELAKMLFVFYVSNFSFYDLLYGSLAVFPLFLIWVYISSFILFFCAQIIYVFEHKTLHKKSIKV